MAQCYDPDADRVGRLMDARWPKRPEGARTAGIHRLAPTTARRYSAVMSTGSTAHDTQAWQLYVEIEEVRPKVWRR